MDRKTMLLHCEAMATEFTKSYDDGKTNTAAAAVATGGGEVAREGGEVREERGDAKEGAKEAKEEGRAERREEEEAAAID
jgi:hypothetical protein